MWMKKQANVSTPVWYKNNMRKTVFKAAFAVYVPVMIYLLFGQRLFWDTPGTYVERLLTSYNLVPFHTVNEFIRLVKNSTNPYLLRFSVINLVGNVVMFVPLGILLPGIWSSLAKARRFITTQSLILCGIELVQWLTLLGSLDIDDVLLNTVGGLVGFWMFYAIPAKFKKYFS